VEDNIEGTDLAAANRAKTIGICNSNIRRNRPGATLCHPEANLRCRIARNRHGDIPRRQTVTAD
jgi:hypothetical protein